VNQKHTGCEEKLVLLVGDVWILLSLFAIQVTDQLVTHVRINSRILVQPCALARAFFRGVLLNETAVVKMPGVR
jgi:hypothetical protein